jgi:formylmethanofuran dehydrogenase subunit B
VAKSKLMKSASLNTSQITATCPACGLLCDDIVLAKNKVMNTNCPKAIAFFEQPLRDTTPLIKGKPATLQQAVAHAAKLIKTSQQPLFAGLSTDVAGFRAVYNLAEKTNGTLQHINAQSIARNLKVLQSTGWQTTTLTEVKNRADVIVCFGDIAAHHPRFFERFVDCDGMFIKAKNRQVIMLGNASNKGIIKSDALQPAWILPCRASDIPSITIALRALVAGKALKVTEIASIKISDLQKIADKLKAAKYAVLAWVAKDLDFPHAELTIQNITETVAILNNTTRAAGLPLGGSDGDTTANNTNTWLSGFALNDETIEHDLMILVDSFKLENTLINNNKPLIIIGNNNKNADVFIPIATPGLDCSGTLFRVDSSVILPLKKVRENNLPTLAEVMNAIETLL